MFVGVPAPRSAFAEVPDALEPAYSEAVLSYNSQNYAQALTHLEELLKRDASVPEFLELKALTLKAQKNGVEAARVYATLIQEKKKLGAQPAQLAPYYFELGMIQFTTKRWVASKTNFEYALKYNFNTQVCWMYLGLIGFQTSDYSRADLNFDRLATQASGELQVIGQFYLGQTAQKQGYSTGAISSFNEAHSNAEKVLARTDLDDSAKGSIQSILEGTEKALAPYKRNVWYGSLSAVTTYDSNILAYPSDVSSADLPSGKGTLKETIGAVAGYTTSALQNFQYAAKYAGSVNLNTNSLTDSSEYANNTLSLYVTRHPLDRTNYGVHLEGNLTFKKQTDSDGSSKFHTYSKYWLLGPTLRTELNRRLFLGAELDFSPTTYDNDPSTDSSKRSGTQKSLMVYVQQENGKKWWNPSGSLTLSDNGTQGTEFKAYGLTLGLADKVHYNEKLELSGSASYAYSRYTQRSPIQRTDKEWDFQVNSTWTLNPKWSVLGNLEYMSNSSNISSTYSFSRFAVGLGANYNL